MGRKVIDLTKQGFQTAHRTVRWVERWVLSGHEGRESNLTPFLLAWKQGMGNEGSTNRNMPLCNCTEPGTLTSRNCQHR
jgi:hypothetical protein